MPVCYDHILGKYMSDFLGEIAKNLYRTEIRDGRWRYMAQAIAFAFNEAAVKQVGRRDHFPGLGFKYEVEPADTRQRFMWASLSKGGNPDVLILLAPFLVVVRGPNDFIATRPHVHVDRLHEYQKLQGAAY